MLSLLWGASGVSDVVCVVATGVRCGRSRGRGQSATGVLQGLPMHQVGEGLGRVAAFSIAIFLQNKGIFYATYNVLHKNRCAR